MKICCLRRSLLGGNISYLQTGALARRDNMHAKCAKVEIVCFSLAMGVFEKELLLTRRVVEYV